MMLVLNAFIKVCYFVTNKTYFGFIYVKSKYDILNKVNLLKKIF